MSDSAVAIEEKVIAEEQPRLERIILALAAFGALWLGLCRHLSGEWSLNEQYSYGWLVPLFCAYLFWLRWEDRPRESGKETGERRKRNLLALALAISALLLLFPLRLFELANPDWRPLSWLHALAVVALTLVFLSSPLSNLPEQKRRHFPNNRLSD